MKQEKSIYEGILKSIVLFWVIIIVFLISIISVTATQVSFYNSILSGYHFNNATYTQDVKGFKNFIAQGGNIQSTIGKSGGVGTAVNLTELGGTCGYLKTIGFGEWDLTKNWTIIATFKIRGTNTNDGALTRSALGGSYGEMYLGIDATSFFLMDSDHTPQLAKQTFVANQFYTVAYVFNAFNNSLTTYMDGSWYKYESVGLNFATANDSLTLGTFYGLTTGTCGNTTFDELLIINKTLIPTEVTEEYVSFDSWDVGYFNFTTPSESGVTKYLPQNYILVNVTQNGIPNYQNMTINLYNATDPSMVFASVTTTNTTAFVNFTVDFHDATYSYNVTATNGTDIFNSNTYTNYISYGILNITAKNYTGGTITNFTVNINNANYSTTIGYINYSTILYQNYTITLLGNYNYTSQTVYVNSGYQILQFSTYPSNSINITTYLESTGLFLNQNFNLNFIGIMNQFNYTLTNGNAFIQNIPTDQYTITFTNANYSTRSYVVTINSTTSQTLNAYIGNGTNIGMYVYDYYSNPLIAVINIQKLIGTSYSTIAQVTTDITGYASLPLVEGTIYQITITSNGYTPRTASFTPYLANAPYSFKLVSTTGGSFISPNYYVSYNIYPNSSVVNQTIQTFSIQLSSPQGMIQSAQITCNGINNYISGSPNGLTAQVNLNLTAYSGLINCIYIYTINGYLPVTLNKVYFTYVSPTDMQNITNTMTSGFTDFQNDNNDVGWNTIIGMFIVLTIVILLSQITQNPMISTFGAIIGTIMMGFVGMFPLNITLVVTILGLGWLYYSQRY